MQGHWTAEGGLSPLLPEGLKHAWRFSVTGCNSTGWFRLCGLRDLMGRTAGTRLESSPRLSKASSKTEAPCCLGKASLSRTSQGTLTVSTGQRRGDKGEKPGHSDPSRWPQNISTHKQANRWNGCATQTPYEWHRTLFLPTNPPPLIGKELQKSYAVLLT